MLSKAQTVSRVLCKSAYWPRGSRRFFTSATSWASTRRLAIGVSSIGITCAGIYVGVKAFSNRQESDKSLNMTTDEVKDLIPAKWLEQSPTKEDNAGAWWTNLSEIAIYINNANTEMIEQHFTPIHSTRPRRKVVLVRDPEPAEANKLGPFMNEIVSMKAIAMIQDEHAQVLLLDIGHIPTIYYYPHIVLSCEDQEEEQRYGSVYGRLLIDRAVKAGLLEEREGGHLPTGNHALVEGDEYYTYPKNHMTVVDLRAEDILVEGHVCTSRGMDGKHDLCSESQHEEECSWCVFMKGGPCAEVFSNWQKCVKTNKDDDLFVQECASETTALADCVEQHSDYYGIIGNADGEEENDMNAEEEVIVEDGENASVYAEKDNETSEKKQ